jgi:hypothetical protein
MNKAFNVRVMGSLLFFIEMKKMQNVFCCFYYGWFDWFMVLNATINNISVISRRLALLVEETGVNHRPVASH